MAEKKVPVSFVFTATDGLTAHLRLLNQKLNGITKPFQKFERLQKAVGNFKEVSGINKVSDAFNGVFKSVGNLASEAVYAAAKIVGIGVAGYYAFERLIGSTIKANSALAETAGKTGASVEFLQKWRFAADQSGSSAEELDGALVKFSRTLAETRVGKGALVEIFGKDSDFLRQLSKFKKTEDAFSFFISKLGTIPNEANKLEVGMAALGKGSSNLINLANLTDEERAKLFKLRAEMGLLNDAEAKRFQDAKDGMEKLSTRFEVLRTMAVARLLPAIGKVTDKFYEWIEKVSPAILKFIDENVDKIPPAIESIASALVDTYNALAPLAGQIVSIVSAFGGLRTIVIVLAGVILGKLVIALYGLVTALGALSVALVTTPIGWVVLALGGMVAAAYAVIKVWEKIGPAVSDAMSSMVSWLRDTLPFLNPVIDAAEKLVNVFKKIWEYHPMLMAVRGAFSVANGVNNLFKGTSGDTANPTIMGPTAMQASAIPGPTVAQQMKEALITLKIEGAPKGSRLVTENPERVPLNTSLGWNMGN